MSQLKFGGFLAPHHAIGENPELLFRRDIQLAAHLDKLGFDEFWCGEHHSSGWETIASPEMFLAAAGENTHRIKLGTGVVSLPYHHPFTVTQRMVQLDYLTRGRVIFGTGPGALPWDAFMLGIDPMVQRDRQDEAIGVIKRLLSGERVTYECDWFTLRDARLQLFPVQEELPIVTASQTSPSGMTLAGKHGIGVISLGSMSTSGITALPTQWEFAEDSGRKHGQTVDRKNWRVVIGWHIAETREQARVEARDGLFQWHNEYNVSTLMRPGYQPFKTPDDAVDTMAYSDNASAIIGTPDDLVKAIRHIQEISGGIGTIVGFAHDWANPEATLRSWELVARYVIPELKGSTEGLRESQRYVIEHTEMFQRAGQAVMEKIMENEKAAAAFEVTKQSGKPNISTLSAPNLQNVQKNS